MTGHDALPDQLQEYLNRCSAIVKRYCWLVQGVYGGKEPLAYTVGLNVVDVPELVIVGISMDKANRILSDAAAIHIEEPFASETTVDIDWTVPFRVREVLASGLHIAQVINGVHHRRTALQLVWPDEHGVYRDDLMVPTE